MGSVSTAVRSVAWLASDELACASTEAGAAMTSAEDERCAECGIIVRPGDRGLMHRGQRFCSETCIDEHEDGWSRVGGVEPWAQPVPAQTAARDKRLAQRIAIHHTIAKIADQVEMDVALHSMEGRAAELGFLAETVTRASWAEADDMEEAWQAVVGYAFAVLEALEAGRTR